MRIQLIMLVLVLVSCGSSDSANNVIEETQEIAVDTNEIETIIDIVDEVTVQEDTLETETTITYPTVEKEKVDSKSLELYLEYLREDWNKVPNPFIATYLGNDFGDYHHIEFEDENGKMYDFGDGNNTYGDYELFFDDDQLTDNPKYLNKTMLVYWEWKTSDFLCCEGEMDVTTAKVPSIVKLELKE